jgi:integrase
MNTMTKIDTSTQNVLAALTAQNAMNRALRQEDTKPQPGQKVPTAALPPKPKEKVPSKKRASKEAAEAHFNEPNINRRPDKGGVFKYTVQIRRRIDGKQHSLSQTFRHLPNAKKWRNKKLHEIEVNGFPEETTTGVTIKDIIKDRLARGKDLGKSALQNLRYIRDHEFGETKVSTLTQQQLYDFADLLFHVQYEAEGEEISYERAPQTVAGYMSHLAPTLKWAHRRGTRLPIAAVTLAMETLWEDEILARSEDRDRRPSLTELDRILTAIVDNPRQKLPVATIMVFAIFSARRIGEICRLKWDDLNISKSKILVRNMKHPRKKKANNVWVDLPPEALEIILSMPRTSEYIFPFDARSVGAAYRRHRDKVGVIDLRLHDLRYEAISRQREMGEDIPFIEKISGHQRGGCVLRYTHVEEKGDKFANWPWLERILTVNRGR